MRRILYLQYTNPAAYPPLQHSATMLAEEGWDVLFVGIDAVGAAGFTLPQHERIRYRQVAKRPGGGARFAFFQAAALAAAWRFRPDWCYASDMHSAPSALTLRRLLGTRILYHEHDAPAGAARAALRSARGRIARKADIVVAPSAQRLALVPPGGNARFVVWNCPRRREVAQQQSTDSAAFKLVYQGSLSRDRLTPQFIDALALLPEHVELHVYGYETAGHPQYVSELRERAHQAGVAQRVNFHGAVQQRSRLLQLLRGHQLGIATIAPGSTDPNLQSMVGASNKVFEYLASAMPVLVTEAPSWREALIGPGYGVGCNPADPDSIANAVRALLAQPQRTAEMGRAGRARILADWNYEQQFAPVMAMLQS